MSKTQDWMTRDLEEGSQLVAEWPDWMRQLRHKERIINQLINAPSSQEAAAKASATSAGIELTVKKD